MPPEPKPDPDSESLAAAIRGRRSVRRFREDAIDRPALEALIESASWAPSAGNRQDWIFTVVRSPAVRRRLDEAVRRRWESLLAEVGDRGAAGDFARYVAAHSRLAHAPVLILVSARGADALGRRLFGDAAELAAGGAVSAAMAAQNLMLAAHARGLGTCCLSGPLVAADELGRLAGLPPRQRIVCLIALGRPAEAPEAPARRPVLSIARFLDDER
jgi:nitroreductase